MSVYSITRAIKKSNSQHSLYSQNSDDSDYKPSAKPVVIQKTPKKQIFPQQKDNFNETEKLPEIKFITTKNQSKQIKKVNHAFLNDSQQRHAMFNQKMSSIEMKQENFPKKPVFLPGMNSNPYSPVEKLTANPPKSVKRYRLEGYDDLPNVNNKSYQMKESEIKRRQQSDHERILKSSQGGRWARSHSLAPNREVKSFKNLVRHYHKFNSILFENLCRFGETFEETEKNLQSRFYKISLYDSLETMKIRMQSYLQRKINLQNISNQVPSSDWSQQEYTNFYKIYKPVLIKRQHTVKPQFHTPYTLKKYKNCIFFGNMHNNKKQEGILHYFNGRCFEGTFKDDQKQFGLEYDDKEFYLGQFKKGLRHGEGLHKTADSLVVGVFNSGYFTTYNQVKEQSMNNSLYNQNNNSLVHNFKKGFEINFATVKIYQGNNYTTLKNNNGDIYIGSLNENQQKCEEGLQIFSNGDIYIGRYEAGSPEGYGQYYWQNGAYYRGQFLSGMRHGRGVWHMLNGDLYDGQYMNDKKNGKGTYTWKNGSKYIGNFENDYRHGYGEMYWQDGRTYKGKWLNGIQKNTNVKVQQNPKSRNKVNPSTRPNFRTIQHTSSNQRKQKIAIEKQAHKLANNRY